MSSEAKKCLDKGFVRLVDAMGDDQAIVDAARVSIAGENVRSVQDNRALIRYLYRKRHTTPFEMVEFKFHAKMPIFVARQWVRHRTANINEMSGRYSELPREFYVPDMDRILVQSGDNKQCSGDELVNARDYIREDLEKGANKAFSTYEFYLGEGVARELARINLPLSTYTEWYWKIDLHNLFHFIALRWDPHAQYEIRVFAEAMAEMVKERCPLAYEAFEDFRLNAMYFTGPEVEYLKQMMGGWDLTGCEPELPTRREGEEFAEKLRKLGAVIGD